MFPKPLLPRHGEGRRRGTIGRAAFKKAQSQHDSCSCSAKRCSMLVIVIEDNAVDYEHQHEWEASISLSTDGIGLQPFAKVNRRRLQYPLPERSIAIPELDFPQKTPPTAVLADTRFMSNRVYNFSAGPAVLPVSVLETVRDEMLCLPGAGASISGNQPSRQALQRDPGRCRSEHPAAAREFPTTMPCSSCKGGSRLQFSMIPLNLLTEVTAVGRLHNHRFVGQTRNQKKRRSTGQCTSPGTEPTTTIGIYRRTAAIVVRSSSPAYVHFTSNETIEGVQFADEPERRRRTAGLRRFERFPTSTAPDRSLRR